MTDTLRTISPVVGPQTFTPRTGTPRPKEELQRLMKPRAPTAPTAPSAVAPATPPPVVARTPAPAAPFAYVLGPRAAEGACWLLGCAHEDVGEVEGVLLCAYHRARVAQFERAGAPTWAAAFVAMVRHHLLEHALCDGCRLAPVGPLPVGQHSTLCAACREGHASTTCRIPSCDGARARSANLALDGLCENCKGAVRREAQALGHAPTGADWLVLVARRLERRAAPERPLCTVCRRRTVAATRAPGDPYVGQCGACRKDSVRKAERAQARADARALDRAKLQRTVAAIRVHVQSLDAALRRNAEGEAPCATP